MCAEPTVPNAHNALMSTLGALTSTHKYLLRPDTPWKSDIGAYYKTYYQRHWYNFSRFRCNSPWTDLHSSVVLAWLALKVSPLRPTWSQCESFRSKFDPNRSQRKPQSQLFKQSLQIPCLACTSRRPAIQIPARLYRTQIDLGLGPMHRFPASSRSRRRRERCPCFGKVMVACSRKKEIGLTILRENQTEFRKSNDNAQDAKRHLRDRETHCSSRAGRYI